MAIAVCHTCTSDETPRTFAVASIDNSLCLCNGKGNGMDNTLLACCKSLLQNRAATAVAVQFSTDDALFGGHFYIIFVLDIPASYAKFSTLVRQVSQDSK